MDCAKETDAIADPAISGAATAAFGPAASTVVDGLEGHEAAQMNPAWVSLAAEED